MPRLTAEEEEWQVKEVRDEAVRDVSAAHWRDNVAMWTFVGIALLLAAWSWSALWLAVAIVIEAVHVVLGSLQRTQLVLVFTSAMRERNYHHLLKEIEQVRGSKYE